jgi:hypothetical protein
VAPEEVVPVTENVWTAVPQDAPPPPPPDHTDHGTWVVARPDDDDRVEARSLAWAYFGDTITLGGWVVGPDLTGRSALFREAFSEELARLQAEASARREGGPS